MRLIKEHNLNGEKIKSTLGTLIDKVVFFLESGNVCIVMRYDNDKYSRCIEHGWDQVDDADAESIAWHAKEQGYDLGDSPLSLGHRIKTIESRRLRNDLIQYLTYKFKFEYCVDVPYWIVDNLVDQYETLDNLNVNELSKRICDKMDEAKLDV